LESVVRCVGKDEAMQTPGQPHRLSLWRSWRLLSREVAMVNTSGHLLEAAHRPLDLSQGSRRRRYDAQNRRCCC